MHQILIKYIFCGKHCLFYSPIVKAVLGFGIDFEHRHLSVYADFLPSHELVRYIFWYVINCPSKNVLKFPCIAIDLFKIKPLF